jgi:hypothetical protein
MTRAIAHVRDGDDTADRKCPTALPRKHKGLFKL